MKKILFTILLIGVFMFTGSVFAADITGAKLTVGPPAASVAAGSEVSLPISVSGTEGKAGGVAFTLTYETTEFTFVGLEEVTGGTPDLQNPTASCGGATDGCNPYTTDGVSKTAPALFYQANDDKNGKVMVAAASAVVFTDGVLFNAKFTVVAGLADGTYDITVTQSKILNADAGYTAETAIPVLVGMPATTAVDGVYPVSDYFHNATTGASLVTLEKGTVEVASVEGDDDKDGMPDDWEVAQFGSATGASATTDYDGDGYSDVVEYNNREQKDSKGVTFSPRFVNAPNGTDYDETSATTIKGNLDSDPTTVSIDDVKAAFAIFAGGAATPAKFAAANVVDDGDGHTSISINDVKAIFAVFAGGTFD